MAWDGYDRCLSSPVMREPDFDPDGLGDSGLARTRSVRQSLFHGERRQHPFECACLEFLLIVSPSFAETSVDSGAQDAIKSRFHDAL
jgi:hypothetical protein